MPAMERRSPRTVLIAGCSLHFLHDGLAELLYVLFPLWAREFSLPFVRVGLLRTGYSGALAAFQVPAGFLAERFGEARLLVAGTLLTGLGFLGLGTAGSFAVLILFLVAGGLGSGTQHPLASSLVSRAYEDGPRRMVLGTYNFSGDLGKTAWTAATALLVAWVGWRWTTRGFGFLILVAAAAVALVLPSLAPPPERRRGAAGRWSDWGIKNRTGFALLSTIHGIDNGSRTAFLTFLPFLLLEKGAGIDLVGVALGLTLAGGAVGKFVCGAIAERLGVIRTVCVTEAITGLGILLLLRVALWPAVVLLPLLGIALNGTSSVLYGTVPDLVAPERRSRAYGLFYTVGIGSGALAPPAFGAISDLAGLPPTLAVLAAVVLLTLPLAARLRAALSVDPGVPR
jgi:MFS family permease